MARDRFTLDAAMDHFQRIQGMPSVQPWHVVIRKANPGGMVGHQTTNIQAIYAGHDHEAGRVIIEPARPLTELTLEQADAILQSVRKGSSWHAYQREKQLLERIAALEAEVARLRASAVDG